MSPQFYAVDVYVGTSHLRDQTQLVICDWSPLHADLTRRQLNNLVRRVADSNRAMWSDLREYSLRAFRVADDGERVTGLPVWSWRYQPDLVEVDRDGWWQL